MINNPFIMLEIEPTTNEEIITQAYLRLRIREEARSIYGNLKLPIKIP
jgi:hypothetical protein